LKLHYNFNKYPERASLKCTETIRKFKFAKITTYERFQKFVKENSIEFHFWRQYVEEDIVNKSCVGNGTCGYQMEFLLHWRERFTETNYKEKDKYIMKKVDHITTDAMTKEFIDYLNHMLYDERGGSFHDINKPTINPNAPSNIDSNTFKNYYEWLSSRQTKRNTGEITGEMLERDNVYFKYQQLYNWILLQINPSSLPSSNQTIVMHPKTIIWKNYYPRFGMNKKYVDDIYTLWYRTWMFKHTQKLTNYSLFQSTINLEYPHIPGYYILFYTTKCEGEKHNYTFNELLLVVNNCNHGALYCNPKQIDNSHYFLLRTFPLDKSLKDAIINLFESINYILIWTISP